jgi:hypothetical protein
MRKLLSKALTNLMAHFTLLVFKNLTLWLSYVELLCLQVVSWKLAKLGMKVERKLSDFSAEKRK